MPLRYLEASPDAAQRRRGTLVLIHAFPLSARMWDAQLSLSAGGWHVVAPHLRGFDATPHGVPAQSMDDYAADLVDLFDTLQIHDAVVGGLSLGGYVAFALLKRAPHYVRGLILSDTRAEADTPEGREGRTRMLTLVREQGASAVADQMIPKLLSPDTVRTRPDIVERVRSFILANPVETIAGAITAMMNRPDSSGLLATVRCPTLVLVGEHDALTPPAVATGLQQRIAGATLVVIPDAGHLPNLEQPEAFNRAVGKFLERRV